MNYYFKKLSIIIPLYNEKKTIKKLLYKINNLKSFKKEIIVVDDASTDGSVDILRKNRKLITKIIYHKKNKGKGAAIKSAKNFVSGDVIIIQDADLEYNPNDYIKLLNYIKVGYKVVYGSRVLGTNRYLLKNFSSFIRIFFNHILTILSNILNNQNLTDAHTCYKVFHKEVFDSIDLEENDFAFCPEVTSKISNLGYEIFEVPISYNGRNYDEGKKIKLIDAFRALKTLIKFR